MSRDYVICQDAEGQLAIFQAPKWSGISQGSDIVIEGDEILPVLEVITLDDEHDREVINILKMLFHEIKRVVSKVVYVPMNYKEDGENE